MPTEPPLPPGNARALVVPTDDAARTVVVAPCGTDVDETAQDAREDKATPNTIRFVFPQGDGDRAVLVPDGSPKAGVSASDTGIPAAAFVLPVGARENSLQVPPLRAESQLLVPRDGKAKTVVLAPCINVTRTRQVLAAFHAAHPDGPRLGVGDLSLPRGGPFGREYGGVGHASHQNGLDLDQACLNDARGVVRQEGTAATDRGRAVSRRARRSWPAAAWARRAGACRPASADDRPCAGCRERSR